MKNMNEYKWIFKFLYKKEHEKKLEILSSKLT